MVFGVARRAFHRFSKGYDETKPLSLICPWITKRPMSETLSKCPVSAERCNRPTTNYKVLEPGMILIKNYISLKDQVDLVNVCEKWGLGPGGFYIPRDQNGEEFRLQMMCFGKKWDPATGYDEKHIIDGSEPPPPIPSKFISLVEAAIRDAQAHMDELPSMRPDVCVANFYSPIYGQLGLHQDCEESSDSLQRGLPVVSISVGGSAYFVYGHTRDENTVHDVYLQSGDVLIFGGKSRLIFHGVKYVFPGTTSPALGLETALRPGRLNLTFRQL